MMKVKRMQPLTTLLVINVLTWSIATAGERIPSNTDIGAACSCELAVAPAPACSYSKSTQNTLCDCGTQCCKETNNTVECTITPVNGGVCSTVSPSGCNKGTEGEAQASKSKVLTGDCGG